ncbi:hypothetical protein [Polyangium sorediatum]|uniref:Uncharacterized protein n=1 Tax=Polyangium sorediatum TaxID=889274 RepID=A0ABT6NIF8_9BACT|nr:hypothetical protein [Polyangium sorediatum]MDI1428077.1 hypothetical protein [Polyangium sorediatum]
MARLTIGQKAERVLKLLIALRNPRIAAALARHGFTGADLDEGWTLLKNVTRTKLDFVEAPPNTDPDALRALDAWENQWFVIGDATLKRHAPEVHAQVFRNLSQTDGMAVIVSVGTFVERLDIIDRPEWDGGFGQAGKDARSLLAQRGLTEQVIDEAKALLEKFRNVDGPIPDLAKIAAEDESFEKAEAALWAWYLEWSAIARRAITQRSLLRQLGFLRTTPSGKDVDVTDDEAPEDAPASRTPPLRDDAAAISA